MDAKTELELRRAMASGDQRAELKLRRGLSTDVPVPKERPQFGAEAEARATSPWQAALIGAGRGFDQLGRGLGNLFMPGTPFDDPEADRAYAALKQQHPLATGIGESTPYMVGGLGAGAMMRGGGLLANLGAQSLTAGTIGLAQPGTAAERMTRGAVDAAIGATGEALGRGFGRMIAPRFKSKTGQAAKFLADAEKAGYSVTPMTRAEGTGTFRQMVEGGMEVFPGSAIAMNQALAKNQAIFNRAAAQAIGETADGLTGDVLLAARKRIGNEFERLMPNKLKVPVSDKLLDDIAEIADKRVYPMIVGPEDPVGRAVDETLDFLSKNEVAGMPADHIQEQISRLGKVASSVMDNQPALGHSLFDIQDAFLDAAKTAMGPEDAADFVTARTQWRNLRLLEASPHNINTSTGDVSAARMSTLLQKRDPKGYYGLNDTPFYVGARFLGDIQPKLPSSGTAERQFMAQQMRNLGLFGGGGGAGLAAAAGGDPITGAMMGATGMFALPYAGARAYLSPSYKPIMNAMTRVPGVTEQAATRAAGLAAARGMMAPLLPVQDEPLGY